MDKVKERYLEMAKLYHPDINPAENKKYEELRESYDVLSDELKRSKHDKELGTRSEI